MQKLTAGRLPVVHYSGWRTFTASSQWKMTVATASQFLSQTALSKQTGLCLLSQILESSPAADVMLPARSEPLRFALFRQQRVHRHNDTTQMHHVGLGRHEERRRSLALSPSWQQPSCLYRIFGPLQQRARKRSRTSVPTLVVKRGAMNPHAGTRCHPPVQPPPPWKPPGWLAAHGACPHTPSTERPIIQLGQSAIRWASCCVCPREIALHNNTQRQRPGLPLVPD